MPSLPNEIRKKLAEIFNTNSSLIEFLADSDGFPTQQNNVLGLKKLGTNLMMTTKDIQREQKLYQNILDRVKCDENTAQWISINLPTIGPIEDFLEHEKLEGLKFKQKKFLDEVLNEFRERLQVDDEVTSGFTVTQSAVSPSQRQATRTFPLITCRDLVQDTGVVEQFLIREEYVESLCNIIGTSDVFYSDVSGGININFEELKKFNVNLIGILGKFDMATAFFQKLLNPYSLREFLVLLEREGSGMYLIIAEELMQSCKNNSYLYFYSKDDEDYQCMNPKSRAVHFIRYISQLSVIMLLLLDEGDEKLLMQKQPRDQKTRERANIFVIKQQQMGPEEVVRKKCGKVKVPGKKTNSISLYGSDNGLYAVKVITKKAREELVENKTDVTAKEFPLQFQLHSITETCNVDWRFMRDYLEIYDSAHFEQMNTLLETEKNELLQEREGSSFYMTQDIAVLLQLYKMVDPTTFFIMFEFFHSEDAESSDDAKLWNDCRNLKIEVSKALTEQEIKDLKTSLRLKFSSTFEVIPTILLRYALEKNTDEDKFDDLFHLAWTEDKFDTVAPYRNFNVNFHVNTSWEKPPANHSTVHDFYKKLNEELVSAPESKALFEYKKQLLKQFDELKAFSLSQLRGSGSVPLSKYPQYRYSAYNKNVNERIEQLRKTKVFERFKEIVKQSEKVQKRSSRKNLENASDQKIISIKRSKCRVPCFHSNYCVAYQWTQKLEAKQILKFYRLCFQPGYAQFRLDLLSNPPKSENMVFKKFCSNEFEDFKVLNIFAVDESFALIVANNDCSSFFLMHNTYRNQLIHSAFLRRPVSHSDFSSKKRLLCLYSEGAEVAELITYRFTTDFRSYSQYSRIDVQEKHNLLSIFSLKIQNNSDYVWILDGNSNRVLKLNIKNGCSASSTQETSAMEVITSKENVTNLDISPNGDCVFLQTQEGKTFTYMTDSLTILDSCPFEMQSGKLFNFTETDQTFSFELLDDSTVNLDLIVIRSSKREMSLHQQATENDSDFHINAQPTYRKANYNKHWIHNLYWVFVKFPCHNSWSTNPSSLTFLVLQSNCSKELGKVLRDTWNEIIALLDNTRKPITSLKHEITILNESDGCYLRPISIPEQKETGEEMNLGRFILQLISFTPVQIARCQRKSFVVLRDGEPVSTKNVRDVFEMKNKISLGLYETILRNWTGSVKVISSMGKQTTGKSYLLNHLTNSSFNISGARCTDGCWMTISIPPSSDCLFVILDFEGQGSFERSDQDDMLLSLLSSALSSITLFKTEKRLDRSTDELFAKFSLASDQLRGTHNLFRGSFAIVVNDVSEADMDDVKQEFVDKINTIIRAQKENNFLSKLYRGGFQIRPFSPFQTDSFYDDIEDLRNHVVASKSEFIGGNIFMEIMKLLMAKLTLDDFTPFNRQQIDCRIKFLRDNLKAAIAFGQLNLEQLEDVDCSLTLLDDKNAKIDTKWQFKIEVNDQETLMDDLSTKFTEDGFTELVLSFTQHLPLFSVDLSTWRQNLENFLSLCVENRLGRVKKWLTGNTDSWKNSQEQDLVDAIASLFDIFELEQKTLRQSMKLCNEKCVECFLKCSQKLDHKLGHCCNTSHRCAESCDLCKDGETTSICAEPLGHDGLHFCREGGHTCRQPCLFANKNNCANMCAKSPNHDDEHRCYLLIHTCNSQCSRPDCNSRCAIDINLPHTVHKCPTTHCVRNCSVPGCNNRCVAQDHFHGTDKLRITYQKENKITCSSWPFTDQNGRKFFSANHFCGNEHLCPNSCEQKGHCILSMERIEQDLYVGKLSTFPYSKKWVSVGIKNPCLVKIPPFMMNHPGQHWCTLNTTKKVHYCEKTCPQCENICDKPYNHEINTDDVLHRTRMET